MKKPEISDNFTLEDIRKIRDYHYEMTKNMSEKERDKYFNDLYEKAEKEFEAVRKRGIKEVKFT